MQTVGHVSIIYLRIDQDFNAREYQTGEFGNGFMFANPDLGMFMGARADLNILSSRKGLAEVRLYAKSYHVDPRLRVVGETLVSVASGCGKDHATEIVIKIPVEEGATRLVIEPVEPPITPASIMGGSDTRRLSFYIHRDISIRMIDEEIVGGSGENQAPTHTPSRPRRRGISGRW